MKEDIKLLVDKRFLVLNCIAEHEVQISQKNICPFSQIELATELNMARMTFSRCLHSLINAGLVQPRGNQLSRYALTNRGRKVVKIINRL